ncbi:MAG: DNA-directed RNA polymerase subunit D [Promethearchaeota archaeon]
MKISTIEQTENYIKLIIEDIDPSFANSLRRIIIAEVPCLAIEDVWIVENDSPLYDEMIAHRLGLIPLKTDLEMYLMSDQCGCEGEGCPQCQVAFTINKKAVETGTTTVYSGDLQSEDPSVVPASTTIPIVELIKGQKLVLEAYAKLGIGEVHAKWQPVSTCTYKYLPLIKIDYEKCEKCEKCVDACPRQILSFKNDQIQIQNAMNCNFCMACEEACKTEFEKAIQVSWHSTKFIFTVESSGIMSCKKIVLKACEILKSKIKGFLDILKSL